MRKCWILLVMLLLGLVGLLPWLAEFPSRPTNSNDEWLTPIEFYGKVVDQNGQPVVGAEIDFGTNDLSPTGSSNYKGASDTNGLFSIRKGVVKRSVRVLATFTFEKCESLFEKPHWSGPNWREPPAGRSGCAS